MRKSQPIANRVPGEAPRRYRVEPLEPRRLLSTVTWISTAGGAWGDGSNWSTQAAPQAGDDVVINQPGNLQITVGGGVSVNSLALTGDTVALQAGAVLTTAAGVANAGTITVAPTAKLSVGGTYSASAGATLSMPGGGSTLVPTSDQLANTHFESPVVSASGATHPGSWGAWGNSFLSRQYALAGSQSLQTSGPNSGASQRFSVTPGASYTLSSYAMTPAADRLGGDEGASMQLNFYDASGAMINGYSAPYLLQVLTASSAPGGPIAGSVGSAGWNFYTMTVAAPANAATVTANLTVYSASGTGGGSVYWDDPQFGPAAAGPSKVTAGAVSNAGTILVGPTNSLASAGTFTQTPAGTLDLQLGGSPSSGAFGSVTSAGQASLAGTLKSELVYNYTPSTTDEFVVFQYPQQTGTFATSSLAAAGSVQFQSAVTFTHVVLAAQPAAPVSVTINAAANLHPVNTSLLGVNLAWWYSNGTTTQTQTLVKQAGLNFYRFPGGSSSDEYHFNSSTVSGDASATTIPQFAQFIQNVAGTGLLTLDYGSGSPQESAAEMAYLLGSPADTTAVGTGLQWSDSANGGAGAWQNVDWKTVGYWASLRAASPLSTNDGLNFLRIGHPAPFSNIKYWEIGNEEYGSWETDHHGTAGPGAVSTGSQHDPATYVAFAKAFATYATEITTTANLPAVTLGVNSGDPNNAYNNWIPSVLTDGASIGFIPDFISDHSYMQGPGSESDPFLLNHTVSDPSSLLNWNVRYPAYQSLLQQALGSQASGVSVMATEFNSVYSGPGKQSTSLVNGLFVADSLGSLLDSNYSGGVIWDLRNGYGTSGNNSPSLYGWRNGGDYGLLGDAAVHSPPASDSYVPYPSYFAEQLASKIITPGGEVQTASSNYQDLHAYAVTQANGHLDLLVINTNPAAALTGQFNLSGFTPSGSAQFWQYGMAQDAAQSQSGTGTAALTNSSGNVTLTGGGFSYSFPAYSMTVIDLTPQVAAPAVVSVTPQGPAGNGTAAGSTAAGQRSQVTKIVVTFSEPVTLSAGAFTLGLVNNYGSGKSDGSPNTDASSTLGTPTNPSGDGLTWILPILATASYSTALGPFGSAGGVASATLNDGVYQLTVNASAVAAAGGPAMAGNYASPMFHRLYGDADGNKAVNAADYAKFKTAFGSAAGGSAYNADLDSDGNGSINALDYAQFKKRFGIAFTY